MADKKKKDSVKDTETKNSAVHMLNETMNGMSDLEDDSSLTSMDDVYDELQNEFDQVRKCIGMYISYMGTDAALHLFREIVHNAFDEFSSKKVPFDTVHILFDERNQLFSISDGGRGIPFAKLKNVCMKKHVSTKYDRSEIMKRFAGRNGVGMKVTVALSDLFEINSRRSTVSQSILFNDGEPEVKPIQSLKETDHGLTVKFIPSEKYLGEIHVSCDMVEDYLRRMSYLIPDDMKIALEVIHLDGKSRRITYTAKGLVPNVEHMSVNLEFAPIPLTIETPDFDLDIAFSYDKSIDGNLMESYCNYVHTTEGGTHEQAVIRAIAEYFVREAKNLDPNSKYEITFDDCKKGLVSVVAGWHYDPGFEGQHKSKVNNQDFLKLGKDCIKSALGEYFQRNNGTLRKIIGILRKNVQVRMEAAKIKGTKLAKPKNALDFMGIAGFEDITDPNYTKAAEILVAEGVSAVGALKNIRNRTFQAVYGVMGVVNNVHGMSLQQVMQIPVYSNFIKVLGCGIGPTFDITKLRFKKIIILTDSDVDGSNITSLFLNFICHFLPELIEAGYVYKAISPLYRIDTYPIKKYYKGNDWLYSKRELYDVFNDIVVNNINIGHDEGKTFVDWSKSQKREFLKANEEYLMEFDMLIARTSGHPVVLEWAAYYRYLYGKNVDKFKKAIEKKFPEITFDVLTGSLTGSYKSESISLIIDDLFDIMAKRLNTYFCNNDHFEIRYCNKNDANPVYETTTIAQFFREMRKEFDVVVKHRFKGLGEAGDELLFITTINPKLRRLVRLTAKDMDDVKKMMELFHGKKNKDREERRNIIATSNISYADIDN